MINQIVNRYKKIINNFFTNDKKEISYKAKKRGESRAESLIGKTVQS